jgi:hypothetical protein
MCGSPAPPSRFSISRSFALCTTLTREFNTLASSPNFLARDLQEKTHNVFNGHEQNAGAQNNFDCAHGDVFLATGGLEKYKDSYFNA